ncbi:immunoglobulin superfamily member 10-like isoform X2 [Haliotis asinina]|uniref:immunoglobulin superfamily member 10-like isoform X2 n=1 Tax=Haliotis asinina TaxID=109174 RepID=UPI00353209DB
MLANDDFNSPSTACEMDLRVVVIYVILSTCGVSGVLQKGHEPPEFLHGSETKTSISRKGAILRLRCSVSANPPADVTWYRYDEEVVEDRKKIRMRVGLNHNALTIRDLDSLDSGDYICSASNRYGKITKTYTVSVVDSQPLQPRAITVVPPKLQVRCGDTAVFKCNYKSDFNSHIQWLLEVPANSTSRYDPTSILSVHSKSYVVLESTAHNDDVLRLPNVTRAHNGKIVCLAANTFGYGYNSTVVQVLPQSGLPAFVDELEDLSVSTSAPNFTLTCVARVPLDLGYYLQWEKEGEPIDPEVFVFHHLNQSRVVDACVEEISSTMTISPLVQGHWLSAREGGQYNCLVQNKTGSTIMYGQATVTFQENANDNEASKSQSAIVSLTPRRVTVQEGDSVSIYCHVRGEKKPLFAWLVKPDTSVPVCDIRHTLLIDYISYRLVGSGETWSRDEMNHLNILQLDDVSMEHAGTYLCYVVQSGAREETTLTVLPRNVGPRVIAPFMGNRSVTVGENSVLQCRAESDNTPTVQWYKEVEEGYSDETRSLFGMAVVSLGFPDPVWETAGTYLSLYSFRDGVKVSDQGKYLCVWSNGGGQDYDQGYLRVRVRQ